MNSVNLIVHRINYNFMTIINHLSFFILFISSNKRICDMCRESISSGIKIVEGGRCGDDDKKRKIINICYQCRKENEDFINRYLLNIFPELPISIKNDCGSKVPPTNIISSSIRWEQNCNGKISKIRDKLIEDLIDEKLIFPIGLKAKNPSKNYIRHCQLCSKSFNSGWKIKSRRNGVVSINAVCLICAGSNFRLFDVIQKYTEWWQKEHNIKRETAMRFAISEITSIMFEAD